MRLLSQLGHDSRWSKAMYNDPDTAREMAANALENQGKKWTPNSVDFDLVNEQLAVLIDLQQHQLRMMSSTPTRTVEPFPRPETAFSKAVEALQEEKSNAEIQRVLDWVAVGQERWRQGHRPTLVPPYEEP